MTVGFGGFLFIVDDAGFVAGFGGGFVFFIVEVIVLILVALLD